MCVSVGLLIDLALRHYTDLKPVSLKQEGIRNKDLPKSDYWPNYRNNVSPPMLFNGEILF